MIDRKNIQDIYELSPLQKGILYHWLKDPDSPTYFEQITIHLKGKLDYPSFEQAFQQLVDRHDTLRTIFNHQSFKQPMQIVLKKREGEIHYIDYRNEPESEKRAEQLKQDIQTRGVDLTKDRLISFWVIQTSEEAYQLVWNHHHILFDGWCLGLILKDLFDLYDGALNKKPISLKKVPSYSRYIQWLKKQDQEKAFSYWNQLLSGYDTSIGVPRDPGVEKRQENQYGKLIDTLSKDLTQKLELAAKEQKVTLNNLFQTAWSVLIQKLNSEKDLVFGKVVAGRPSDLPYVEEIVGLFINTIPVRVKTDPSDTFQTVLQRVHKQAIESEAYDYVSLAEIQSQSMLGQDLLDHIIVFENYPLDFDQLVDEQRVGFRITGLEAFEQTNYDLDLTVYPGESLQIYYTYYQSVYQESYIQQLAKRLKGVLEQIIHNPLIPLQEIEIVTQEEKQSLLDDWNSYDREYERFPSISAAFAHSVQIQPDAIAVELHGEQITYEELQKRSQVIAQSLREQGLKRNQFVGIMVERSIDMIVGMLGIIHAGGAYVPIDPSYPEERIAYILENSESDFLLKQSTIPIGQYQGSVIDLDVLSYDHSPKYFEDLSEPSDFAYMIYTSGSTGMPKGVMIDHQSVISLGANADLFQIQPGSRVLQFASFSFDSSVGEIFYALLNGATLVLVDKNTILDPQAFLDYLKRKQITSIPFISPSMLRTVPFEILPHLQLISTGGEELTSDLVQTWGRHVTLVNAYGPTEATVDATVAICKPSEMKPSIGHPVYNKKVYVLNDSFQLVPPGSIGELFIGGEGIAQGYWKQPELTKEKFLPNPYKDGEMIYRTGDYVRWLPHGELEFIGRIDQQVKIRGHRIEVNEIESALLQVSSIQDAVVIPRKNANDQMELYGYIVSKEPIMATELRTFLKRQLPAYMIPSYFVKLDEIPLTPNGKVDRKYLETMVIEEVMSVEYVAPRNELEQKMVEVWQEVLQVHPISIEADFFELGGHSLKAMTLISRIQKAFQVQIPLKDFFINPTVEGTVRYINQSTGIKVDPIPKAPENEYYPVSSQQRRMFVIQQMENVGTSYHMPAIYEMQGSLQLEKLEESLRKLIHRHDVFRTTFHFVDGELKQKIHKEVPFQIELISLDDQDEVDAYTQFIRPFDLATAPLIRAAIARKAKDHYLLFLDLHHIISDGVSSSVMMDEWMKLYQDQTLPVPLLQYQDYAGYQQQLLQSKELQKQKKYWLNELQEKIEPLHIPTDFARPAIQSFDGDLVTIQLRDSITNRIVEFVKSHKISPFQLLFATYQIFLSKISAQQEFIIGTPVSGRSHPDLTETMGLFVNTLALKSKVDPTMRLQEFIQNVKNQLIEAGDHADYPLEELIDQLNLERDVSRNPLFDTMFLFENKEMSDWELPDLEIRMREIEWKQSKLDLTFYIRETNPYSLLIEYNTKLFQHETVQRMGEHYLHLLEQILENQDQLIQQLDLITPAEQVEILQEFNQTEQPIRQSVLIHQIFEEQVTLHPERIAIQSDLGSLTYQELNRKSNQLAHYLRAQGVQPDDVVGIYMDRSLEMMIAILGVLKSGGAYMPISTTFPEDRIQYMLENSAVKYVCSVTDQKEQVGKLGATIIDMDQLNTLLESVENPTPIAHDRNLAYVLYTSGSTGRPKGVMIEHYTVINRIDWMVREYQLDESDVLLQKTPIFFDVSVWELFMWFFVGAKLHLLQPNDEKDPTQMIQTIEKYGVTTIHFVPSMFHVFLEYVEDSGQQTRLSSLRRVFTSGEELLPTHVNRFHQLLYQDHGTRLYNLYGPTEATVDVSYFNCDPSTEAKLVPIGKPIQNVKLLIIGKEGQLQPIGVPGELCISGICLARGYLNQEDLTAEKFVPNPYLPGEKMYRTGDLACWLPDGNIRYLGRFDHQVKIRGYRIELDEVASWLNRYEKVKEGVVVARKDRDGNDQLVAYYLSDEPCTSQEIRQYLLQYLPDYMVPAHFMWMESLPITANGKLDRKALPIPEEQQVEQQNYVAPVTAMEVVLADIWKEVLTLQQVGIYDNFFELGGDSIKAIHIVAKLNKMGLKLQMNLIFRYSTIAELAPFVDRVMEQADQGLVSGEALLTPIQSWFFEQEFAEPHHWNQAVVIESKTPLKSKVIEQAFQILFEHHDTLRLCFEQSDSGVKQIYRHPDECKLSIKEFDLAIEADPERKMQDVMNQLHASFYLDQSPFIRAAIFKNGNADRLFITAHHLVIDGVSWRILLEDLEHVVQSIVQGTPMDLPLKTMSVQQWSQVLRQVCDRSEFKQEQQYWENVELELTESLPVETSVQPITEDPTVKVELSPELTKQLLTEAHRAYQTEMNDLLLTALSLTLTNWNQKQQVTVFLEGHGREEIIEGINLTRSIGWFTSMYPVVLPAKEGEWVEYIRTVKEQLRQVPSKGIGYGINKYLSTQKQTTAVQPEVMFNYLGQFDSTEENADWKILNESVGQAISSKNHNPYLLELVGSVSDGQLKFTFYYQPEKFHHQTIQDLSNSFQQNLIHIIQHCIQKDEIEHTPSDFSISTLSLDELDDVFEALKD